MLGIAAIGFALNMPGDELWARVAGGVMVLIAALWAVNLGQTGVVGSGKATGLVALGAEVIYLYAVTFGSLMDTAVAFLLGGVLFIAAGLGPLSPRPPSCPARPPARRHAPEAAP